MGRRKTNTGDNTCEQRDNNITFPTNNEAVPSFVPAYLIHFTISLIIINVEWHIDTGSVSLALVNTDEFQETTHVACPNQTLHKDD